MNEQQAAVLLEYLDRMTQLLQMIKDDTLEIIQSLERERKIV